MQPAKCSGCGAEEIERVGLPTGKTPIGPCQPVGQDISGGLSLSQSSLGFPCRKLIATQCNQLQISRFVASYEKEAPRELSFSEFCARSVDRTGVG